jgi:hypothetical protein
MATRGRAVLGEQKLTVKDIELSGKARSAGLKARSRMHFETGFLIWLRSEG